MKGGHGCVGCTTPHFWDAMSPFYQRLPAPLPFAPSVTADQLGQALVGGVAALTVAHGAASVVRERLFGPAKRGAPPAPAAVDAPEAEPPAPAAVEAPEAATPGAPAEADADVVDALVDGPRATPGASSGKVG